MPTNPEPRIDFVRDANELARLVAACSPRSDLFLVDLANAFSADAIVELVRALDWSRIAAVTVYGPASEEAHDRIDDYLLDLFEDRIEQTTAWIDRDLSPSTVFRDVELTAPTGRAIVWVADDDVRTQLFLPSCARALGGRRMTAEETRQLRERIPAIPDALTRLLSDHPIIGAYFRIKQERDLSGMGVDMLWMSARHIMDEAFEAYPGKLALPAGYIPIGSCAMGSGDPYFYRIDDGAVVRIQHELGEDFDRLTEDRVELVAPSIAAFLAAAFEEKDNG